MDRRCVSLRPCQRGAGTSWMTGPWPAGWDRRTANELRVPLPYLTKVARHARPERQSLADVRKGEYEGLAAKLEDPEWIPDFGGTGVQSPLRGDGGRSPALPGSPTTWT